MWLDHVAIMMSQRRNKHHSGIVEDLFFYKKMQKQIGIWILRGESLGGQRLGWLVSKNNQPGFRVPCPWIGCPGITTIGLGHAPPPLPTCHSARLAGNTDVPQLTTNLSRSCPPLAPMIITHIQNFCGPSALSLRLICRFDTVVPQLTNNLSTAIYLQIQNWLVPSPGSTERVTEWDWITLSPYH